MNHRKAVLSFTSVLLLLASISAAADGPKLTFKFKEVKFPGAAGTSVYGVNNAGVMVGQYYDQSGVFHGFMLDHGKGTTIDDPNGTDTLCGGINSSGAIVGQYTASNGDNHGFLYENGKFTDIAPEALSVATGINDPGDVVGSESDCDFCQQHGFLWKGHKFKQLDVPGAMWTGAGDINNSGVITIIAPDNNSHYHSYLYRKGKYTEIKVPKAYETFVEAINNVGDVLFTWDDRQSNDHGALRHGGVFYRFNYKGLDTIATGVNDHHLIVGVYIGVGTVGSFKATF